MSLTLCDKAMVQKHKYGVVLDAGSSGSRVYVYRYKTAEYVKEDHDEEELGRLPKIKTKKSWNNKVKPGISTFGEKPELVGEEHLKELVKFAEEIVPEDDVAETPIFLLATAGMRLLPGAQRAGLLESVCSYLQNHSTFQVPDCDLHIQVIPGETEGLYGWIAANYLLGGFDEPEKHQHGNGHHTYGFLDMGGASAQIAFAPNATEAEKHANDLKLLRMRTVGGDAMEFGVFVTTWLRFGANEARARYVDRLLEASPNSREVPDPCLPKGLLIKPNGDMIFDTTTQDVHLVGTGRFAECLRSTYPLLEKDKPCEDAPCLLNGVHTPAIDFNVNHFVGVSEFWHTTHEVFAMAHKDRAYDLESYQKQVTELCERRWDNIKSDIEKEKWGHKVDEQTLEEVCFKASWLINMLHEGIGVPRVGLEKGSDDFNSHTNSTSDMVENAKDRGFLDPFQAVNKIDDTDVSWTLGKMVLYASSQMPPANGAMAVGFGRNVPGTKLPADFQYAFGKSSTSPTTKPTGSKSWSNRLLHSDYSRRIPGLLIFLTIIVLVVYLICGRERRQNIWRKVTGRKSSPGSSRRPKGGSGFLRGKLFGNGDEQYERVLEEAETEDFELASDIDAVQGEQHFTDSSSGSRRTGRSSGWATPLAGRALSPDMARGPSIKGYFDAAGGAAGLGITPFERGGLIVRTDSKERLAPLTAGSLGRNTSPRKSPLVAPLKESVD